MLADAMLQIPIIHVAPRATVIYLAGQAERCFGQGSSAANAKMPYRTTFLGVHASHIVLLLTPVDDRAEMEAAERPAMSVCDNNVFNKG